MSACLHLTTPVPSRTGSERPAGLQIQRGVLRLVACGEWDGQRNGRAGLLLIRLIVLRQFRQHLLPRFQARVVPQRRRDPTQQHGLNHRAPVRWHHEQDRAELPRQSRTDLAHDLPPPIIIAFGKEWIEAGQDGGEVIGAWLPH